MDFYYLMNPSILMLKARYIYIKSYITQNLVISIQENLVLYHKNRFCCYSYKLAIPACGHKIHSVVLTDVFLICKKVIGLNRSDILN